MTKDSITLFLMTEKGLNTLQSLNEAYIPYIKEVVIGKDSNLLNDYQFEIIEFCKEKKIPHVLRKDFLVVKSKFVLAIAWRWMIEHQEDRLIILHDSLLPKYRGFAPLVNSLINGETRIGVTALFGATGYDEGDILHQAVTEIEYPMKVQDAIQLLKRNYADLIEYIFLHIVKGLDFSRSKQDHEAATYSVWRDEEDYFIDWTQSSSRIKRSIDALGFPYVGAKMRLQDEVFTVDDAEEFEDVKIENRDAGKAIFSKDGSPVVICGSGLLKINSATRMNNGNYEKIDLSSRFRIRFKTANGAPIKK